MSKKIRIKDIAEMAQVSVGTVDRVIHNRGEVAEDSYKKIMAILEKTGYKPNLLARTLGSNKTFRIVALMPNPAQDEYWEQSAEGVKQAQDEWTQYGVEIQPYHFDLYNKESFAEQAQSVLETQPDAVLTAPIFHQEALNFFRTCREQNIPFVVVNNTIEEGGSLSF